MIRRTLPDLWVELELVANEAVPWQASALCAQTDPEFWYPDKGGNGKRAKKVCVQCPVREECLEAAIVGKETYGVWGGTSRADRRKIWAERDIEIPDELEETA